MLIFITGYMGAGKTTLGKRLAERLNYKFHDLDEMLEISTGYSIPAYFEKFGEASFRLKERDLLISHMEDADMVMATGGGTACYADNMTLMNKKGITIFLDTPFEIIMERMTGYINQRPLLKDIPAEMLPHYIREHMKSRQKFYLLAKIRVDGSQIGIESIVGTVISLVTGHH